MSAEKSGAAQKADNDLVLSFLSVRRAIGCLGYFLPLALIAYGLSLGDGILTSISAYYYTPMREVFVGTLCAIAVFLWSYEGYRPAGGEVVTDKNTARVAAIGALAVALAPLPPADPAGVKCTLSQCLIGFGPAGWVHGLGALLFFGAFAVFSLHLFVKGSDNSMEKRASKRIYRICGWLILICMALMVVAILPPLRDRLIGLRPVFWLETIANFAFATSWLVKGDAMRPLVSMAAQAED